MLSINGREMSLRAYCSQFNFRSGDQQARAGLQRIIQQSRTHHAHVACEVPLPAVEHVRCCALLQKKVGVLSGGERNRLQLAKVWILQFSCACEHHQA